MKILSGDKKCASEPDRFIDLELSDWEFRVAVMNMLRC